MSIVVPPGVPAMTLERLKSQRQQILELAARHGAKDIRVFGSTAKGVENSQSDIDLLVDLEPGRSLLDLGKLLIDLQELLGCRVDLITVAGLHWYIRDRVLQEAVPL